MLSKVLIVAVDDYQNVRPLNGCLRDAEDIFETLVQSAGYDPRNIRYLANDLATRQNIMEGLKWLAGSENALCYFAGHGTLTSDRRPALVPYDFPSTPETWNELIDDKTIEACLGDISGVIIYDCCHSGSLGAGDKGLANRSLGPESAERFLPNPNLEPEAAVDMSDRQLGGGLEADQHLSRSSFIYLGGCRDCETSKEIYINSRPRGVFSYNLCRHLRDDPRVGVADLWRKASQSVGEFLKKHGGSGQHPQLWCRQEHLDKTILGEPS